MARVIDDYSLGYDRFQIDRFLRKPLPFDKYPEIKPPAEMNKLERNYLDDKHRAQLFENIKNSLTDEKILLPDEE